MESFAAYFGRLITLETLLWIGVLMLIGFLFRKPLSKLLRISIQRYLFIALAFAGVIGLSIRFWEWYGTLSTFWLVAPELWSAGFRINANLVLNVCLYVPPSILLVLARKSWWRVLLALGTLSFLVETLQQSFGIGSGDPMDWFANIVGAVFGTGFGFVLLKVWPSLEASSPK